jgi:hypothetical protein
VRKRLVLVAAALIAAATALLFASASSQANPVPSNICSGIHAGGTWSSIIVPSWSDCEIANATVIGSVSVSPNSSFRTCNVAIGGGVNATQAYVNMDPTTTVGGSINLSQPGFLEVAGSLRCLPQEGIYSYSSYICPHYVGGGISVQNLSYYSNEVSMGDCGPMNIKGGVTIKNNWNLVEFFDSTVHGSLYCANNWPPPDVEGVDVYGVTIGCSQPCLAQTTTNVVCSSASKTTPNAVTNGRS